MSSFYDILNSRSNATFDELKSNYKQLILQCHPDKLPVTGNQNAVESNGEFVAINKAWNTLKDPAKRKLYDAELLLTKFQMHNNIFERLKLSDMKRTITSNNISNSDKEAVGEVENVDDNDKKETPATFVVYSYNCRCGGQYIIDESDANNEILNHSSSSNCESIDKFNDVCGDGDDDGDVIVECNECSLVIILNGGV